MSAVFSGYWGAESMTVLCQIFGRFTFWLQTTPIFAWGLKFIQKTLPRVFPSDLREWEGISRWPHICHPLQEVLVRTMCKSQGKKNLRQCSLSELGVPCKNWSHLEQNKNGPKFDIRWLCSQSFNYTNKRPSSPITLRSLEAHMAMSGITGYSPWPFQPWNENEYSPYCSTCISCETS